MPKLELAIPLPPERYSVPTGKGYMTEPSMQWLLELWKVFFGLSELDDDLAGDDPEDMVIAYVRNGNETAVPASGGWSFVTEFIEPVAPKDHDQEGGNWLVLQIDLNSGTREDDDSADWENGCIEFRIDDFMNGGAGFFAKFQPVMDHLALHTRPELMREDITLEFYEFQPE